MSVPFGGVERDDLAHQAAADALVAILAKLDDFAGASRFSTWAYGFVMFEVSRQARRHPWRGRSEPLAGDDWAAVAERSHAGPDEIVEWRDLITALGRAMEHDLTAHQRRVLGAVVMEELPLKQVIAELGMSPNAVYKAVFDARRRLRVALAGMGHPLFE